MAASKMFVFCFRKWELYTITSIFAAKEKVAIKIGDRATIAHKKKGHELNREKDILFQCDHPNIVKLYEAFIDTMQIYMVLQYCELDLFDMCRKIGLGERLSKFYAAQVFFFVFFEKLVWKYEFPDYIDLTSVYSK